MSWSQRAPKRGPERARMLAECGKRCFLLPDVEKFPICEKCRPRGCGCRPDCAGLRAAIARGSQWGYADVVRRARAMRARMRCDEGGGAGKGSGARRRRPPPPPPPPPPKKRAGKQKR
jgi:hypothetical protein